MSMFNVGDVVAVDLNAPYNGNCRINDNMRVNYQGGQFTIVSSHETDDGARYRFEPCAHEWVFVDEWLTLVQAAPDAPDPDSLVPCYDGEERTLGECFMLTEPSEFAGMYARIYETRNLVVSMPLSNHRRRITLLENEVSDLIIEISGNNLIRAEVDKDDYVECAGGSCRYEYIWRSNAVYVEDSGYYHEDDQGEYFWYHNNLDEYRTYEPEEEQGATLGYHTTKDNGYVDLANPDTLFTIGFEVEKEDGDILCSYEPSDLDDIGWAREHDGSLDDETGYELVSPIYDLFDDKLDKAMDNRVLKNHINADSTTKCGGHINYGKRGMTGSELLKESTAFLPLFLALYRKRVTSRWAKMKVDIGKYDSSDRYVAFNVQHNYIEFRLISRVHDVDTLLWRRDLFRIMANNGGKSVAQVQRMMLDRRNVLHKHLRKMYTEERLLRLVCWYSQFADAMFDTLSVSKTGHGVMLDFFIASLKRIKKRVSIAMTEVIGWANEVSDIISRVDGGDKYAENIKPLSCEELKFLGK